MRNTKIFLRDERIFKAIIDAANLTSDTIVLEIGSGDGRLTRRLAEKAKKVYAVEFDLNLLDASKMFLKDLTNVVFVHSDFLKLDIPDDSNRVVSNLPYAISSPATEMVARFLDKHADSMAIIMYQKEFAERMLSFPGLRDYSMLSVFSQYALYVEKVVDVRKSSFKPMPSVDSIVLKMTPKRTSIDDGFLSFCRLIFQHKKKSLYAAVIDSRSKLSTKSKDSLREKLKTLDENLLKTKVFFFSVDELLNIYSNMVRLSICQQ